MRQTFRNLGLLAGLLSLGAPLAAEPVVGGYLLERLPGGKTAIIGGKNLVLAHVFNQDAAAIKAGRYDVGVEVQGAKGVKTYVLKPGSDLAGGALKTFRLKVPLNANGKPEMVRTFARIDGRKIWSEPFAGSSLSAGKKMPSEVTTLYTEVAPEASSDVPPREVPFEGEIVHSVHSSTTKTVVTASPKKKETASPVAGSGKPAEFAAVTAKAGAAPAGNTAAGRTAAAAPSAKPRVINPNEFKSLRTIDEELVIYVVKVGDTLQSVAERYYGDAGHVKTIADLNFIEARAQVKPGEEIIVDVKPLSGPKQNFSRKETTKTVSLQPAEKKAADAGKGGQRYTIQEGDTLAIIAKRFYGKASKAGLIIKANPGLNPKNLKIGIELDIPDEKGDQA